MFCPSTCYDKTVSYLDLNKFMGQWYILAGRFTVFEKGFHNSIETYQYNSETKQIHMNYTYRKNSFTGDVKSVQKTGWVHNTETNAHWKISPFWPLQLDYLIIDIAEDYSWAAIGIPNQKYLWIIARDHHNAEAVISIAVQRLDKLGYDSTQLTKVPHKH